MTNTDDVTTIKPNANEFPDAEQRYLACFVETMRAAHVYLLRIAEARSARGITTEDLEHAQDTLLDLKRGFSRAAERRSRDVGSLTRNKRLQAVR